MNISRSAPQTGTVISWAGRVLAAIVLAAMTACAPTTGHDPFAGTMGPLGQTLGPSAQGSAHPLPPAQGQIIGSGPVRVAMLLPLSGQQNLSQVAGAIRDGATLALEGQAARGTGTIHIVLKDTGASPARAQALAREAILEGAELIIGPVQAEAVAQAGTAARAGNVPLIGLSNTASVATPGVYLFSILPEAEIMRSLGYAARKGARNAVALVPANGFGRAQGDGFARAAAQLGVSGGQVIEFADEAAARNAIERIVPQIRAGHIDTLFLPDRATAPSFATLLSAGDVGPGRLTIIGSSGWQGDSAIAATRYFEGAIFAAPDPAGLAGLAPDYRSRFGVAPSPFASLGFSLALLANSPVLSQSAPRFSRDVLTRGSGFTGRDGAFRFHRDGRTEMALAVFALANGAAQLAEPAGLGGLPNLEHAGTGSDAGIPPALEYR